MREFAGKTAVITGGASGMGYAFAERFAAEGMNVVLGDIETDALNAAVTRLEQQERNVLGVEVNTMRRETLENLRDQAVDRFGKIHVLCNNAGVTSREDAGIGAFPVWEVPDSTWDWVMGVNFWGVLYGVQVFVPHMLEHGETGHIVNTSSVMGLVPSGSAYGVAKHGVLTLTEGLWHHLRAADSNVSASVLCPGFVNTQITEAERNRPERSSAKRSRERRSSERSSGSYSVRAWNRPMSRNWSGRPWSMTGSTSCLTRVGETSSADASKPSSMAGNQSNSISRT